jgi:hypothetical protein
MAAQAWNLESVRTEDSLVPSEELVLLIFDEVRVTLTEEVQFISQFRLIRLAQVCGPIVEVQPAEPEKESLFCRLH